ncbi:DUF1963 domain-containing protein [Streptomyces sp. NPDC048639]|uniref:DUF1963 domain-containing protein n=1 Tax=Streptomyces sp. NPDC048639 TaxID=3365581 RepID=UPI003723FFB2
MEATFDVLSELAVQHLPSDLAEKWIGQLRPGIALEEGTEAGPVVGYLGGLPKLADDMEWPVWKHGPLSLIASIDCAALPAGALDIPLPESGTLLFFCFGHGGDNDTSDKYVGVDVEDRETWDGARVLYVPAGVPTAERETPLGLEPHIRRPLSARETTTAPDLWHVCLRDIFAPGQPLASRWETTYPKEFFQAACDLPEENTPHRIGGHANVCQNPVEEELAYHLLGRDQADDARLSEEARGWVLLGHFYGDGSHDGWLYWLIRPQDLAERRFDRAMFIFQAEKARLDPVTFRRDCARPVGSAWPRRSVFPRGGRPCVLSRMVRAMVWSLMLVCRETSTRNSVAASGHTSRWISWRWWSNPRTPHTSRQPRPSQQAPTASPPDAFRTSRAPLRGGAPHARTHPHE